MFCFTDPYSKEEDHILNSVLADRDRKAKFRRCAQRIQKQRTAWTRDRHERAGEPHICMNTKRRDNNERKIVELIQWCWIHTFCPWVFGLQGGNHPVVFLKENSASWCLQVWDDVLAGQAQAWADQCAAHWHPDKSSSAEQGYVLDNTPDGFEFYGQNFYRSARFTFRGSDQMPWLKNAFLSQKFPGRRAYDKNIPRSLRLHSLTQTRKACFRAGAGFSPDPGRVVEAWYNETVDYTYSSNACTANKVCGHYTQVLGKKPEKTVFLFCFVFFVILLDGVGIMFTLTWRSDLQVIWANTFLIGCAKATCV